MKLLLWVHANIQIEDMEGEIKLLSLLPVVSVCTISRIRFCVKTLFLFSFLF